MPRKVAENTAQAQQEYMMDNGLDNYELPKAIVARIAKSAIPENARMQTTLITALLRGSTVFINYLGAAAQDAAIQRSAKTIAAADVLKAVENIDFNDMLPSLESELEAYREVQKSIPKAAKKAAEPAVSVKGKEKALPPSADLDTSEGGSKRSSARTKAKKDREKEEKEKEQEKQKQKKDKGQPQEGDADPDKPSKRGQQPREIDIPEDEVARFDEEEEEVQDDEDYQEFHEDEENDEATLGTDKMQVDENRELIGRDVDGAGDKNEED
ncbi:histone-fold-containing protein [Auriculariales sp. MPI-PUGE-AT-0066]|nr:histone-fold-containing protein [Auriculariales sp. MPI-PUGE-AT-0066]